MTNAGDITGRKSAEEQIRFQARLLDAVGQAIIATDPQGTIIYWNRAAEELYGWSKEEVMDRPIVEVTPSQEMLERAEEIMSELRAGRSWSGEFMVQRKDGSTFPVMVTDTPVHDEQGSLEGIIGYTPEEHYADPQMRFKIVHPDDRHRIEEELRSPETPITIRWLRKDGG